MYTQLSLDLRSKAAKVLLDAGWTIEDVFEVLGKSQHSIILNQLNLVNTTPQEKLGAFKKVFSVGVSRLIRRSS